MKHLGVVLVGFVAAIGMSACGKSDITRSGLQKSNFETEINGKNTSLYVLENKSGMEVCITNYGGRIVSIMVPDRDGNFRDVCLGHDSINDYLRYGDNFGALIGRYGNRIAQSKFELDGQTYNLVNNDNGNSLHGGGPVAFHNRVWDAEQTNDTTLVLTTLSPDGEDGYPGDLNVTVTYTLGSDNDLKINYQATTTKPTVVNLTNHCYFCLSGDASRDVLDETLTLNAEYYTPIDRMIIPTGEVLSVCGTPFEFRWGKQIGYEINKTDNLQLTYGRGYDHNFVLSTGGDITKMFGELSDPHSGIVMQMYTTEPGVQFYSGNFLDGRVFGKKNVAYPQRSALCFETQHYPDSPNRPDFPSTVLRPGETYNTTTIYKFTTK